MVISRAEVHPYSAIRLENEIENWRGKSYMDMQFVRVITICSLRLV